MHTIPPTGRITRLQRVRDEDHGQDTLALWEQNQSPRIPSIPWTPVDTVTTGDILPVIQGVPHIIVSCTRRAPQVLRDVIERISRHPSLRMYLLAHESWKDDAWLQGVLAKAPRGLLVRLGDEPPGDWIVGGAGSTGRLFVGSPGQPRRWMLAPDIDTLRALFQAFTWMFWHHSRLEVIPHGGKGVPTTCLPPPNQTSALTTIPLARGLLVTTPEPLPLLPFPELVVSPDGAPWPGAPTTVLTPHDLTAFTSLPTQHTHGVSISWTPMDLPRMGLTRKRGALALEEGSLRLQVELESPDSITLMHHLEDSARTPHWRFFPSRRLADVSGPIWIEGATTEIRVHDLVELDHGTIPAPELDTLAEIEPQRWRRPEGLARVWRYHWEVTPPVAPRGATEARLLSDWRTLDAYVVTHAEALRRDLKTMEEEESSSGLLSRMTGLLRVWDTVKRQRRQINDALDEILEDPISRRPKEAPDLVQRLRTQHEHMRRLRLEARQAEEAEERRMEEDLQRAKYDQDRAITKAQLESIDCDLNRLRSTLSTQRSARETLQQRLTHDRRRWESEQEATQGELESEAGRAQRERTERLLALEVQEREVNQRLKSANNALRKKLNTDLSRLRGELTALKKPLPGTPAAADQAPSLPDTLRKLETELGALDAELKELTLREETLQQKLDETQMIYSRAFVFRSPAQRRRPNTLPDVPQPPPIPSEGLPEFGRLLEHGGRRFLEISTWDLVERARPVAARLAAKLVAPP